VYIEHPSLIIFQHVIADYVSLMDSFL